MTPEDHTLSQSLVARGLFDAQTLGRMQAAADVRGVALATVVAETGVRLTELGLEGAKRRSNDSSHTGLGGNLSSLPRATPPAAWGKTQQAQAPEGRAKLDVPTVLDRPRRSSSGNTTVGHHSVLVPAGSAAEPIPERLGPFRVLSEIAAGGMGVVYKAYHEGLQRECAVKVLSPELRWDEETVDRFLAETRMAAKVGAHPNLVRIFDAGSSDGHIWLAMELVVGTTVGAEIKAKRLTPREGAALLVPLLHRVGPARTRRGTAAEPYHRGRGHDHKRHLHPTVGSNHHESPR